MNESSQFLDNINIETAKTIQLSTFLEPLLSEQKIKLKETIKLLTADKQCDSTIVFRGVERSHLIPLLTKSKKNLDEGKLLSLLFYFGEKAKHYYKVENKKAKDSRWIKEIEDCSESTIKTIYDKIKKILKSDRKEIVEFKKQSLEFSEFFMGQNKIKFIELIKGNERIRDYYLFFLHTAGKIGIDEKTILVSTSVSPKVPLRFFNEDDDNYMICYVIPPKLEHYAVSHLSVPTNEFVKTHSNILPVYNGNSLYPDQKEIAVKGALFSHHMFGIMKYSKNDEKSFFPNPHLFTSQNEPSDMLCGLNFDQSFFEMDLEKTGYHRGVGLSVDAQYHTINKTLNNK